jgi:dolichol-phosphate mannosyltransferase
VLVTGATGFVGANLARRLLRDGHEVHLLVHPGYTRWRLDGIRRRVALHEVDLAEASGVAALVHQVRPGWVFHLAAHGAYSWQTDLARMVQANIVGTVNLVQACLAEGFDAFVNTGSSSEYGFKRHAPTEQEWLEPNSHYAVTKASATLFCRHAAQRDRLRLCTLRLYSVFGPWEEPQRLMPTLVLHGLRGRLPRLVSPDVARDYVYVDDVVEAYLAAATVPDQEPGAVYNVCTGVQTSIAELVTLSRQVLGVKARPRWGSMPNRTWDTAVWVGDPARIGAALGWRPRYTVESGFRRLAGWLRRPGNLRRYTLTATRSANR